MRDDERSTGPDHPEEEEERFDDALDDLFGPDEDDNVTRPRPSEQRPQPPGGSSPPPRAYEPDPEHHEADARHVFGPDNAPPPPSYDTFDVTPEPAPEQTSIPVSTARQGRNWRRIACFGCLVLVGVPALCLLALIVIGLVAGDPETEPAESGVFVDATPATDPTAAPTPPASAGGSPAVEALMVGRAPLTIVIDGEAGFGTVDKPVPLTVGAELGDGWELQVNAVTENADQSVADANMFNDPPALGRQFLIAKITATNDTGAAAIFDASFRLRLAGASSGNTYTTFDTADRCGVIPEPVEDEAVPIGGTVSGNVCWQVRTSDVERLVLYNESFSELDGAIWFAVTRGLSAR